MTAIKRQSNKITSGKRKDKKGRVLKDNEHQRPNGTYDYTYTNSMGQRKAIYAKTLEELREKENDLFRDLLDGIKPDKNNITINDLYYRWKQLKKGLKANTFQNYTYMYELFVEPAFGKTHIKDLKRTDVRAFYNYLADERHVKPNTIDTIHTVLHQVLELGVEDDYLRYNPSDNALKELKRAHNKDEDKRRALTQTEQELFETFLSKPHYERWKPIFTVMLYTGLRIGEICGLRWEDINLDDGIISVNHTLVYFDRGGSERCGYAINTPKTTAGERTIPMLPKVKAAFIAERQFQELTGLKCNSVVDGYTDFVFVNRFGNVQNQSTLNKALRRIIRDCNYEVLDSGVKNPTLLPNFTNHSLRHTFTTRMCEAGVNVKAMQAILGHADAETTLQIYADATKELKQAELINFEEYFSKMRDRQNKAI